MGVTHPDACFNAGTLFAPCCLPIISPSSEKRYSVHLECKLCAAHLTLHCSNTRWNILNESCGKKSQRVSNKKHLPCPTVTLKSPLRSAGFCFLYSNTRKHWRMSTTKWCTEQWFDSRDCQMASLLCCVKSPGGMY